MKWFFALNEQSEDFKNYSGMLKVAVLTAQKFTSLKPHILYDGEESDFTEWLRSRNVTIIKRRSFLYDKLASIAEARNNRNYLTIGSGAFLRTEIPQIAQELGFTDKYVLYTDVDVMFLQEVTDDLQKLSPKYFAVAPERFITEFKTMNSGVMLMNVKKLRSVDVKFRQYIVKNIEMLVDLDWDQGAYKFYFRNFFGYHYKWNKLDPIFNWKPYWGQNPAAKIVHFHGPKPYQKEIFSSDEVHDQYKPLIPMVNSHYLEFCRIWRDFYELI